MSFLRELSTSVEVIAELRELVASGESIAIILWPTQQFGRSEEPPKLRAYFSEEGIRAIGLKDNWFDVAKDLYSEILSQETLGRIEEFEASPGHDHGYGESIKTKVFTSCIDNLSIQVVHLYESSSFNGGYSIGDGKRIILVNRDMLEVRNTDPCSRKR